MEKQYKLIKFTPGENLESAVNKLLHFRKLGVLVYGIFNGITMFSDTVDMDEVYKAITGLTLSEFKKEQEDGYNKAIREKEEFNKRIPELTEEWIKKGHALIDESEWEHWDSIVPVSLAGTYRGRELECCLDIIKCLKEGGTFEDAEKMMYAEGHSGRSWTLVCCLIEEFYSGEFVDYINR